MSFVVAKRAIAAAHIEVTVNGANGEPVEIGFVAQYQRHTLDQVNDLQDGMLNQVRAVNGDDPLKRPDGSVAPVYSYDSDVNFLKDKMTGWLGVKDDGGERILFNIEALDHVLSDWPELVTPLFNGFFAAHKEVKRKN